MGPSHPGYVLDGRIKELIPHEEITEPCQQATVGGRVTAPPVWHSSQLYIGLTTPRLMTTI